MILNYLELFESDSWRDKRIWHVTKNTGQRRFVKIKSLTPEEQDKYRPLHLKNRKKRKRKNASTMATVQKIKPQQKEYLPPALIKKVLNFYIIVDNIDDFEINEGELVDATNSSTKALQMEQDDNMEIIKVTSVPIDAIKQYKDEEGDWQDFEVNDDEKYDMIKYMEEGMFKLDLYPVEDLINLDVDDDTDDDEEDADNIEDMKSEKYNNYLELKHIDFLIETGEYTSYLLKEEALSPYANQILKNIADTLGIRYNGINVNPVLNKVIAFFTDQTPVKKDLIISPLKPEYEDVYDAVKNRLEIKRHEFKDSVEPGQVTGTTFVIELPDEFNAMVVDED